MLLAAPIMAAGTWLPALQWVALGYLLLVSGFFFAWRRGRRFAPELEEEEEENV